MTFPFFFLTVFLSLLSFNLEELSCKDPELSGVRQGVFSHYDQSPTDGTIDYHQTVGGALPLDMSAYAGVVAVEDCSLVGRDAWVRITDDRALPWTLDQWRLVKVFDCSGHDSTSSWMAAFNILGELGYYFTEEIGMYGQYNIEGEIAFEDPALAEACGYTEMYTAKEQSSALAKIYIEDSNPPPILTPLPIDDPESIPALLTAMPALPTATPTPTPTETPSPTVTAEIVAIVVPVATTEPTVPTVPTPFIDVSSVLPVKEAESKIARWIWGVVILFLVIVGVQIFIVLYILKRRALVKSMIAENARLRALLYAEEMEVKQ